MLSFINFVDQNTDLSEALITFGGKAYPKFGTVVIMAGGAGSGKGFIKDKLVGVEGYNFDVDELKMLTIRTPGIAKKVKAEFGVDLSDFQKPGAMNDPNNVYKLHTIVGDELKIDDKRKKTLFASILLAAPDRKPNLIFDVTMKSLTQLQKYTLPIQELGYDAKNIHIVWVVNDIEVAKAQNLRRARTVPAEILVNTHRGASHTMHDIVKMGNDLRRYMDGDIVFAFNKVGVDSELVKREKEDAEAATPQEFGGKYKGGFIKTANYFYVKRSGKPVDEKSLTSDIRHKISTYVPPSVSWE
jgi:hypothetical protein